MKKAKIAVISFLLFTAACFAQEPQLATRCGTGCEPLPDKPDVHVESNKHKWLRRSAEIGGGYAAGKRSSMTRCLTTLKCSDLRSRYWWPFRSDCLFIGSFITSTRNK